MSCKYEIVKEYGNVFTESEVWEWRANIRKKYYWEVYRAMDKHLDKASTPYTLGNINVIISRTGTNRPVFEGLLDLVKYDEGLKNEHYYNLSSVSYSLGRGTTKHEFFIDFGRGNGYSKLEEYKLKENNS